MVLASRAAVRDRVSWPNPRLAILDTCRRMSSIEVLVLLRGLGRPSTSQRIFGFRVARARFFLVLSARHPEDSFIHAPYIILGVSIVEYHSIEIEGSDENTALRPSLSGIYA